MEAKELMIGDWCAYGVNCKGRVTALTEHLITLSVDGDEINGLYMLVPDMVRPIPLTEEILVKNGFDRQYYDDGDSYWWAVFDGWFNVNFDHSECSEGEFRCVQFRDLVINYVHQLQHFLRLCNIDKEISI